jgi:hypothetical protein
MDRHRFGSDPDPILMSIQIRIRILLQVLHMLQNQKKKRKSDRIRIWIHNTAIVAPALSETLLRKHAYVMKTTFLPRNTVILGSLTRSWIFICKSLAFWC